MATFSRLVITFISLLAFALAFSIPHVPDKNNPSNNPSVHLLPTKDPFYTAPPGYEATSPGTILRLRVAPGNLSTVVGNCSVAYHILYRTTSTRYRPSYAVTTLYVPKTPSGKALLSYQYPYNTPDVDRSPSYDFYVAPPADLGEALGLGWLVNVPDHQGPVGVGGMGVGQGLATLDSVRATLSMGTHIGLHDDARYAMWGYSGGSIASEWAAELQAQYAPELHFSGMAIGGTPTNISSVWVETNGTPYAGMVPLGSTVVTKVYPEAYAYLVDHLKVAGPHNRTEFLRVLHMSAPEAFAFFAGQDMWDYFVDGRAVFEAPILRHLVDGTFYMGYHGVPQMPVFMYHAIHDEVALIGLAEQLRERFCRVHVDILFERNTVGDHIGELTNGAGRALAWLGTVFQGKEYVDSGCIVREVTVGF
ncbi:lipase [Melanomma pulvis-pyrius CBS 109.77]|uniref:Lipase n=1 Tax=Melanomma pulvis-pyrius CBS 109.77 TaxID=1314802 RepID=A0A6A6X4U4_9PLEO|nr:lipase [Melanomma pulvis-pyrius CBS 109.77]